MSGTKYDRFFINEFVKKMPKAEAIAELIEKVKVLSGPTTVRDFEKLINVKAEEAVQDKDVLRMQQEKREEE